MAWTTAYIDVRPSERIFEGLCRAFPHILRITTTPCANTLSLRVDIEERDFGVWEWNEEVVPDARVL